MRLILKMAALILVFGMEVPLIRGGEAPQTERVIFVMTDGFRWEELFSGGESRLMSLDPGGVKDAEGLKREFDRPTAEERRAALLPFIWSVIAKEGQIWGNPERDSIVEVTNGKNFSYPGYSEILCGFADPRIDSNKKIPNPNFTVFEWLYKKPRLEGKVAAFAAWDVFPSIFNAERCGFLVNAGYEPLPGFPENPKIQLLNALKVELPKKWGGEPYDAITFQSAYEYLRTQKPKLLFLSLGETDEWGHEGRYDEYLVAAQRFDSYLRKLWETLQEDVEYRGKTTMIISTDHGRGGFPAEWKSHGEKIAGSERIWLMAIGPDTAPLGEREKTQKIGQNQIAATIAALLGEDYVSAVPQAGGPIEELYLDSSGK